MAEDRRRVLQARAAAVQANPREVPNGAARSCALGEQVRASTVIWKERERFLLEGYASVVEKRYRMWDMFGEYDEVVSQGAFDETLSKNPDVAYLINHRGLSLARTTTGSLELQADGKGLFTRAYLNPERSDVQDLMRAIEDRNITEMSFAFRIDDGEWNEDYTEYRIHQVDLDRGDVSAVNYGASPHTSVAARQAEVVSDAKKLPEGAQRALVSALQERLAAEEADNAAVDAGTRTVTDVTERVAAAVPGGRSVALIEKLVALES
jgi:HK97 family phage prohead protease